MIEYLMDGYRLWWHIVKNDCGATVTFAVYDVLMTPDYTCAE